MAVGHRDLICLRATASCELWRESPNHGAKVVLTRRAAQHVRLGFLLACSIAYMDGGLVWC
jgi:hypothetical protein